MLLQNKYTFPHPIEQQRTYLFHPCAHSYTSHNTLNESVFFSHSYSIWLLLPNLHASCIPTRSFASNVAFSANLLQPPYATLHVFVICEKMATPNVILSKPLAVTCPFYPFEGKLCLKIHLIVSKLPPSRHAKGLPLWRAVCPWCLLQVCLPCLLRRSTSLTSADLFPHKTLTRISFSHRLHQCIHAVLFEQSLIHATRRQTDPKSLPRQLHTDPTDPPSPSLFMLRLESSEPLFMLT